MKRSCWVVEVLSPVDGTVIWRKKDERLRTLCDAWERQTGNKYLTVAKLHNWKGAKPKTRLVAVRHLEIPIHELALENVGTN
jgi:hypothetical protein